MKQALQSFVSGFLRWQRCRSFADFVPELLKLTRFLELCDWPLLGVLPQFFAQFLWFWFQLAALSLIRVVFEHQLLRSAGGTTFTTAVLLRETALFIYDAFNFFLDSEKEIGKRFCLGQQRTGQVVNRHRESVGLLTVGVQIRFQFKCQTNLVLNHCWFSLSHFPPNDRIDQSFNECCEGELIAHGIVGINFPCKITECQVETGHIMAGDLPKGLDGGLQNVGVWLVLLPEETLEFIVAAFLGSSQGPLKNQRLAGEAGRKERPAVVGSQSNPIGKPGNGLKLRKKDFDICKTREAGR